MKVIFYTSTSFLDVSLEIIKLIAPEHELHVLIEITDSTKRQNIVQIGKLPDDREIVPARDMVDAVEYSNLEYFFRDTASVNFVVFNSNSLANSFRVFNRVNKFVRKISPEIFHLEALAVRALGLIPCIMYRRKLVISVHDPLPHSGEKDLKLSFTKRIFFNLPISKAFIFYSRFARDLFNAHYNSTAGSRNVITMAPYSYFKHIFGDQALGEGSFILFFGRISVYKGVGSLLMAMAEVLKSHPDEELIIAGKPYKGYRIDEKLIAPIGNSLQIIDNYVPASDLARLISKAKFVVCPYLDATQSGVIMTAFALDKPVIVTDTGSFPEYVSDNINGWIVRVNDHRHLAEKINSALQNREYQKLQHNISRQNETNGWETNRSTIDQAYS